MKALCMASSLTSVENRMKYLALVAANTARSPAKGPRISRPMRYTVRKQPTSPIFTMTVAVDRDAPPSLKAAASRIGKSNVRVLYTRSDDVDPIPSVA
jgi:hypothetical protein